VRSGSEGCVVTVRDEVTGSEHVARARCVVNAAGPWVETLLPGEGAGADSRPSPPRLHLSKGVHLVLARERLPVHNIVMMTAADGRPVFAIPRGAVTYVGTTDTTHVGGPEHWPDVTAADIDYLMGVVNAHFDVPQVTARDILATWAGLRPLIHQAGKAPKEMSRRDEIWRTGHLITVAGGKLTGFRKMAEEAMAAVGEVLGCDVTMPRPLEPLAGGAVDDVGALARRLAARYQVPDGVAVRLARLYGSEAAGVLGDDPRPLSPSVFAEEVMWAIRVEGARTLEDVIYRRLRTAWFLPGETRSLVPATADLLAAELGLAHADIASQSVDIQRRLDDELVFHRVADG
jgi:glycerol-3-phosphate dehydrogenase